MTKNLSIAFLTKVLQSNLREFAVKLEIFNDAALLALTEGVSVPHDAAAIDDLEFEFNEALISEAGFGFSPRNYWRSFKEEMIKFICGPKEGEPDTYADLRQVIGKHGQKSQTVIIGTIAAFVGAKIGAEAGVIVPFVASIIAVLKRVGTKAFCQTIGASVPN